MNGVGTRYRLAASMAVRAAMIMSSESTVVLDLLILHPLLVRGLLLLFLFLVLPLIEEETEGQEAAAEEYTTRYA